jgi:hypothetical protein
MLIWLVVGGALLVLAILALQAFVKTDPKVLARGVRIGGGAVAGIAALWLAVTGRYFLAVPLGALALAMLGWRWPFGAGSGPFPGGGFPGSGPSSTGVSTIETATLRMTLDHASGEIDGEVLTGPYAGQKLGGMARDDLMTLLTACRRDDPDSAPLLEAFLDRMHGPEWRDDEPARDAGAEQAGGYRPGSDGMTREEALRILGLEEGATEGDIKNAHRQLMKRFHPDQGGSSYLAAKINEAKDILLGN